MDRMRDSLRDADVESQPFRRQAMGKRFRVALGMAAVLVFAPCCTSPDNPLAPEGRPETVRIELTPASAILGAVGATQAFSATARDTNGNPMPGVSFTWSSDDPTVATVNAAGEATAVRDGEATITAEAAGLIGSGVLTVSATITNVARVSAVDQSDLNSSNDTATATLTVTVAN